MTGRSEEPATPPDLLVFFCAAHSGPARRMESLLAHLARKERHRLRVTRVDVDEQPELAERFKVRSVPTLVLVKGKRAVGADRRQGERGRDRGARRAAPRRRRVKPAPAERRNADANRHGRRSMRKLALAVAARGARGLTVVRRGRARRPTAGGGTAATGSRASLTGYQRDAVGVDAGPAARSRPDRATGTRSLQAATTRASSRRGRHALLAHPLRRSPAWPAESARSCCGGGGKPACTPTEGTFEGDIDASDVVGPSGQGIAPGEIGELITAMRRATRT